MAGGWEPIQGDRGKQKGDKNKRHKKEMSKSGGQRDQRQESKRATEYKRAAGGVKTKNHGLKTRMKKHYLNARSIRNKVNELTAQIITNGYDLVAITETWLQGGQDWELNIQGYLTIQKDRQEGKGGGVALLIKDDIRAVVRDDIGYNEQNVESLWVEIKDSKGKKSLVGVVYRSPNNNFTVGRVIIKGIMEACEKGTAVVMGDFNLHIDWSNQIARGSLEEKFIECIRDCFLEQYVTEPTREQAILDLILCNETGKINDLLVKDPLGMSDHNMVEFVIQSEDEEVVSETSVLCLNKGDYSGMRAELAKIDWKQRLNGGTIEEQWRTFKELFHSAQQKYIPVKKKGGKRRDN
uniref:uncharacterized protein n=1 Tax=Pristiophorus japonicus TaxID=55135 RepID=UPI00398F88A5